MLPLPQPLQQARKRRLHTLSLGASPLILALSACPTALHAQDGAAPGITPANPPVEVPDARDPVFDGAQNEGMPQAIGEIPGDTGSGDGREIGFEADSLSFDSEADIVSASGNVVMRSGDQSVRADNVSWDRNSGQIVAEGNIRFVDEHGNQLFTDRLELTDELKAGAMSNLLLALREGGRLAAQQGERADNGDVILTNAAYSACAVETAKGCPRKPSWRVTADRVIYDQDEKRVRFKGAMLELFGARLLPLPGLAITTDNRSVSGLLVPNVGITASNGLEVSGSYYLRLADNQDLTATGYVYADAPPMAAVQYRAMTGSGAFQTTGYLTRSTRLQFGSDTRTEEKDWRGYFFGNGKFQLDEKWSITGAVRVASDRTFLRRYDISNDDRLRSTLSAERIDDNSYFSISGWATQVLLRDQDQGLVPVALPLIDYRKRLAQPVAGGTVELQANSLNIVRRDGQDTQRAFARAQWDLRRITSMGQEITLTGMARGDVYHSSGNVSTTTPLYRGLEGWQGRAIALAALDMKWPLIGEAFGGTQILTPRVQLVASPHIRNFEIPNEDSRAVELEDTNLFSLNRFPGYDRFEDGVRVTYGMDWQLRRPGWQVEATIGQSYRLNKESAPFPEGTGLQDRFSDFAGRVQVRYRDFVKFTHRFRLDKDSLAVRRNEVDATLGSDKTYLELGYLRLDRDIDVEFEDLQDREELRAAARISFANYWSVFGAAVLNLTDRDEDPTLTSDGFEPLRTRLGVAYSDDCLELGVTWRRDYVQVADARRGNTFQFFFALRNLSFR
ncbi:LPS assembly protein LptD [Altericroceibacterium endophyticum]|uniref:LPS-assembly protein LptD n=1 Tax=Altericroceibacterium endophyticum TaxID=1808508 RepID=A0A6I4T9T9_9SPHN|nr:LPS assembly protein LptD [Altericroceibacterium endophyticum]